LGAGGWEAGGFDTGCGCERELPTSRACFSRERVEGDSGGRAAGWTGVGRVEGLPEAEPGDGGTVFQSLPLYSCQFPPVDGR
jgi:hypothetical protein